MTIGSLRLHTRLSSRMILFAVMLQTAAAAAPAACPEMASAPESVAHAGHFASVFEAEIGNDASCDCSSGEPAEPGEHEFGSCVMAAHCASSPAVIAGASILDNPAVQILAMAQQSVQPQVVALSHPTPPPRV